jgi:hypothetical protein
VDDKTQTQAQLTTPAVLSRRKGTRPRAPFVVVGEGAPER